MISHFWNKKLIFQIFNNNKLNKLIKINSYFNNFHKKKQFLKKLIKIKKNK